MSLMAIFRREYFPLSSMYTRKGKYGRLDHFFSHVEDFIDYLKKLRESIEKSGFALNVDGKRIQDTERKYNIKEGDSIEDLLKEAEKNRLVRVRLEFRLINEFLDIPLTISLISATENLVLCVMGDLVNDYGRRKGEESYTKLLAELESFTNKRKTLVQIKDE